MWDHINQILNQSLSRMTSGIANFLPGLLALLAVLLLSLLLALLVRMLLRRSLRGINFDSRLDQWGFSWVVNWTPSRSPTQLIARLSFWTIVFLGAMAGASALDAGLPSQLAYRLFAYLPNVLAAILVLGVGTFLARFLARGVLISAVNMQIHSARLLGLGVKWLILLLAGAMAMEHLGIGGQIVRLSFGILFGGIVLALALAVGLGSKDIVSRTLERQASRSEEQTEEHFHHL